MHVRLIALHGFLGRAEDWDVLREETPWATLDPLDLWPLTARAAAGAARPADAWRGIGAILEAEFRQGAGRDSSLPSVLLAYSFGARLTLSVEALAAGRLPVAATCLVSCHPGLADDDVAGRRQRADADEGWARQFETAPAEEIWKAWNAQPVLQSQARRLCHSDSDSHSHSHSHTHSDLPSTRATLAAAMRNFSVAEQPDFVPRLAAWRGPLVWVTGETDAKFRDLAARVQGASARAEFAVCPRAGHRAPWDDPREFAALLRRWLAGVPGID